MKNTTLKLLYGFILASAIAVVDAQGAIVVNDTWIDGNRNDPPAPTYSENGTDTDADGNVESIWFASAFTNMTVVNPSPGVTPGVIRTIMPTSSYSWETYFTPEAAPVTLANPGDQIKVTWAFRLTTVNTTDASQSFRVALADSPGTNRLTGNATTPGPGPYSGYAMFMNMSTMLTLSNCASVPTAIPVRRTHSSPPVPAGQRSPIRSLQGSPVMWAASSIR